MDKRNIRNYEVSIWTLQDEFITVLKHTNLESKGQIQEPILSLSNDDPQEFSFSIPMYIYEGTERRENPIWYTTRNGVIQKNLRKIKVIINKGDKKLEKVFEFLIKEISENHVNDVLTCDVHCTELAFEELGKIGYKISLTAGDLEADDAEWFKTGHWNNNGVEDYNQPNGSIQYWNNKIFGNNTAPNWTYEVRMNWDGYLNGENRSSSIIYEEEYLNWKAESNGELVSEHVLYKEKWRSALDLKESNIYNLTQNLAELFGVFCRYEYAYDENYHIIGRKVIYYNNYLQEEEGYLDLTYPYSTAEITRTCDSDDLVTKMFVRPVNAGQNNSDLITIMDVPANKSREDYILNFDYLKSIDAITDEQQGYLDTFDEEMFRYNSILSETSEKMLWYQERLPELEAKVTTLTNSIELDQEQYDESRRLFNMLTDIDGVITRNENSPDTITLLQDTNTKVYYAKIARPGIKADTLRIYNTYNAAGAANNKLSGEITNWRPEYDSYGNLEKIYINNFSQVPNSRILYTTYSYEPKLYYEKISQIWLQKFAADTGELESAKTLVEEYNSTLEELQETYDENLTAKQTKIKEFETIMGAALREGYWQPEDYTDYGNVYDATFYVWAGSNQEVERASFFWDTELFDYEQNSSYKFGILQEEKYYPCIDLTEHLDYVRQNYDRLSFLFYDNMADHARSNVTHIRSFAAGSQAVYGFLKVEGEIRPRPVLILLGATTLTEDELEAMYSSGMIGVLNTTYNESLDGKSASLNVNISSYEDVTEDFITDEIFQSASTVFPRIKVNSLVMRNTSDELILKYNDSILEDYEDYYVLTRYDGYYLTLKPETVLKNTQVRNGELSFRYTLSNADLSIYLDALQISKENAFPKVSYDIKPNVINSNFIATDYMALNRVVNINDVDLKFEDVKGYISKVEVHLETPWDDTIEIKNYTSKFEDLFSSIVAQTEAMKKSAGIIGLASAVINGNGTIDSDRIKQTYSNIVTTQDAYEIAKFDDVGVVNVKLEHYFNEAGEILKDAAAVISGVQDTNIENRAILGSFVENVQAALQPNIFTQATRPTTFKPGDIWNQTDPEVPSRIIATYIAMAYSSEVEGSGTEGWNKTYDGTLASITGAALNIDTVSGRVDITAATEINLNSGNTVNIAANENINITGNKEVNIGGTKINIGSSTTPVSQVGEIHLVASNGSHVDLTSQGIELGASNITMKSGASMEFVVSNGTGQGTTAISLSEDKGIWIGSGKEVRLFSGTIDSSSTADGAGVVIAPDKILFGVSNRIPIEIEGNPSWIYTVGGTAVEMTEQRILLSAIEELDGIEQNGIEINGNAAGIEITPDKIGFATGTGTLRNTILMNNEGITLASGTTINKNNHSGSYVSISNSGIDFGSSGNIYLNTANVQLQTNGTISDGTANGTRFALGTNLNNNNRDAKLVLDGAGNLYITGSITATALNIVDSNNNSVAFSQYIDDLNSRIDDEIQTWFGKGTPKIYTDSPNSSTSSPLLQLMMGASGATTSTNISWQTTPCWTIDDADKHIGDIYYDIAYSKEQAEEQTAINEQEAIANAQPGEMIAYTNESYSDTAGQAFRFIKRNGVYQWQAIDDTISTGTANRVERIHNGDLGLAFENSGGNAFVTLNNTDGLVIMGNSVTSGGNTYYPFFKATNNAMGFFQASSPTANMTNANNGLLYYENGSLTVKGAIYASSLYIGNTDYASDVQNISSKATTYYQTSKPINYKKGDIWQNSQNGLTYVASADYDSTMTLDLNWTLTTTSEVYGTKLTVDADAGDIEISAANTLNIQSGQSLTINTLGNLYISGSNGVTINSGSKLTLLSNTSLDLQSSEINLRTSSGATAIQLSDSGIVMTTNGDVTLKGNSGSIVFGTDPEAPNFSVSTDGIIYCEGIVCRGDIQGDYIASGSGYNGSSDNYFLSWVKDKQYEGWGSGQTIQRTCTFTSNDIITPGFYNCQIDWKLINISGEGNTIRITNIDVMYEQSPFISLSNQGSYSYGSSINIQDSGRIYISNNTNSITFTIELTTSSEWMRAKWETSYNQKAILYATT